MFSILPSLLSLPCRYNNATAICFYFEAFFCLRLDYIWNVFEGSWVKIATIHKFHRTPLIICFPSVSFCTSHWCTLSRVSCILLSSINIDAVFLGLTPGGKENPLAGGWGLGVCHCQLGSHSLCPQWGLQAPTKQLHCPSVVLPSPWKPYRLGGCVLHSDSRDVWEGGRGACHCTFHALVHWDVIWWLAITDSCAHKPALKLPFL